MTYSRRRFFQAAGAGAVGSLLVPWISGRGLEAMTLDGMIPGNGPTLADAIRLNSNENPNGPGSVALDAIRAALGEANRYPRAAAAELKTAIAKSFGLEDENVVLGCGSSDILRANMYAFTGSGRSLVTASPSYESPPADARRIGARVHEVPVTGDLKLDLDAMADVARGAGLVYLCNPNNPTSTVHGAEAIKRFVARVRDDSPDTMILIDEAYHEYVDDPSYATSLPLALENPRVVIARTFSKVFGLAGMRVGYALGDPKTIKSITPHVLNLGVNNLAASAALAGLPLRTHIANEVALNRTARAWTMRQLSDAGFPAAESQANFLMVDLRRDAQAFRDACKRDGVLVGRPFPPLDNYVRISIGTMPEMQTAMEVFRRVLVTSYAAG